MLWQSNCVGLQTIVWQFGQQAKILERFSLIGNRKERLEILPPGNHWSLSCFSKCPEIKKNMVNQHNSQPLPNCWSQRSPRNSLIKMVYYCISTVPFCILFKYIQLGKTIGLPCSVQVHPRNRPSVEQLLQMPQMLRHSSGLREERDKDDQLERPTCHGNVVEKWREIMIMWRRRKALE